MNVAVYVEATVADCYCFLLSLSILCMSVEAAASRTLRPFCVVCLSKL